MDGEGGGKGNVKTKLTQTPNFRLLCTIGSIENYKRTFLIFTNNNGGAVVPPPPQHITICI